MKLSAIYPRDFGVVLAKAYGWLLSGASLTEMNDFAFALAFIDVVCSGFIG